MAEIRVFSDKSCTYEIEATYVSESGHNSGFGDGSSAFDDKSSTVWRPQCANCDKNAAWLTFTTKAKAQCVTASNLGSGSGGGQTWNGGIVVELQNSDNSWTTAMQSESGNSAQLGISLKLVFQIVENFRMHIVLNPVIKLRIYCGFRY